jgi:hypothetical protein
VRATKSGQKAFEDRHFVEPLAWTPPYQAWQERAESTRELATHVTNERAKKLLLVIAESYDRLAAPV